MHRINVFLMLILINGTFVDCNKSQTSETGGEEKSINSRPIIGIVTQKVTKKFTPMVAIAHDTYIASSYVKYIESAGAQVVPILSTYPKKKVMYILKRINGVLFPGGDAPLDDSGYAKVTKWIFEKAKQMNDDGIYFPLWGISLGFEVLSVLGSGDQLENILSDFDAENVAAPIIFEVEAFRSRMFVDFDMNVIRAMMFSNITYQMHGKGISSLVYDNNDNLKRFFKVLGSCKDRQGKTFISIIEGTKYPFYGTQFQTEKTIFEWTRKIKINHSLLAIKMSQLLVDFFVNEARKNNLSFETYKEAEKYIITRYSPVYSGGKSFFEQVYIFDINGPSEDTRVING